jgi:predicted TIM-barrel fold metal-dependent hydrolase
MTDTLKIEVFKIDSHVHVFTTDMPLIDNPRHAPKYSFTHEQLIATLDANGVERAIIAAASPWGDYNDYMLEAVRAHPKRLRATAIVKPTIDRFALEAMSKAGFIGIRLPFIGLPQLPDITTFEYRALFRRLADLDWHVHPHVDGDDLPKILPTLEASGVKIVVDHLGRPNPKTGIESEGFKALQRSIEKGRTWVKVSGGYRLGSSSMDTARELVRTAGPDRLVWASDCPFVGHENQFPYKATMDWLDECVPDATVRAKIFGETALKLYFGGV